MAETVTINQNTGIASSILDGITFSNINLTDGYSSIKGKKFSHEESQYDPNGGNNADKIFNAVDIDWNGADFTNAPGTTTPTTINTTGLLIDAIKWASKRGNDPSSTIIGNNEGDNIERLVTLDGSYNVILVKLSGDIYNGIDFYPLMSDGKNCHVIFTSKTGEDLNVLINGSLNLILPNGESELSLSVPGNGYAEINFLNISNVLYVRGI